MVSALCETRVRHLCFLMPDQLEGFLGSFSWF